MSKKDEPCSTGGVLVGFIVQKCLVVAVFSLNLALAGVSNSAQLVSPGDAPAVAAAPQVPATAPPPGETVRVDTVPTAQIPASGPPIVLEAGKGTLIKLPRPASTVFIANPDIADVQVKSPSLIYLNAKAPGETVLYAVDADDHILLNAPVRVEHDLSRLRDSMRALIPGEDVNLRSVDNALVLSGKVSTAGQAEKLRTLAAAIANESKGSVVNQLSVATPNQVNLRVKIAEVDRNVMKALGFNLSKTAGNIQFQTLGIQPTVTSPTTMESLFQFAIGGGNGKFFATLDALEQEGLLTTLAEPNLTATSGQPAYFNVGGQFPYPVAQPGAAGGVATVTVVFKPFGVSLAFTPTIIDADHVNLHVHPDISALDFANAVTVAGTSVPALTERTADTTVELGSGQSFALAGLLQNDTSQNVSKIPGLGDIPILGQLFRSDAFQRHETELVIIVTPYLVMPSETAVALPTDGYIAPHDIQRIINSDLYRQGLPPPAKGPLIPGDTGLIGPAGFRLD
jgi:pilus assembly protein CpaC